jgi:Protein of unknown function (DUF1350)
MEWKEIAGSWVYLPRAPRGLVHFLGGAFVATAPQLTYRFLLEDVAKQGYGIIATPFFNTFDHDRIVAEVYDSLEATLDRLPLSIANLPIYGMGHSMGCKVHLCSVASTMCGGLVISLFLSIISRREIQYPC